MSQPPGVEPPMDITQALASDEVGWMAGVPERQLVAVALWNQGRVVFSFVARGGRWVVEETASRLRGTTTIKPADWRKLRSVAESQLGVAPVPRPRSLRLSRVPDFPGLGPGVFQAALDAFKGAQQGVAPSATALALLTAAYVEATALGRGQSSALLEDLAAWSGKPRVAGWRRYMTAAGERGLWDVERSALTALGEELVADFWAGLGSDDAEHERLVERELSKRETHRCFVSLLPGAPAHVARL